MTSLYIFFGQLIMTTLPIHLNTHSFQDISESIAIYKMKYTFAKALLSKYIRIRKQSIRSTKHKLNFVD